jgi:hypothetical protein
VSYEGGGDGLTNIVKSMFVNIDVIMFHINADELEVRELTPFMHRSI